MKNAGASHCRGSGSIAALAAPAAAATGPTGPTGVGVTSTGSGRDANQVIATVLDDLLRTMRTQVLLKMVKPYNRLGLPFISAEIGVPVLEVESLVAGQLGSQQLIQLRIQAP